MEMGDRQFPADAIERACLWREWINMDSPAVEARHVVRRVRKPTDTKPDWLPEVIDAPQGVLNGIATAVRESMTGDQLTADDRNRLIARAMRLGLSRFESNLLIAAVVHRSAASASREVPAPRSRRRLGVASIVAAALAIETVAAAVLWQWWRG